MEKKQNISNAAVAVIAIIALGAAIYFGLKWFPLTGDQIVDMNLRDWWCSLHWKWRAPISTL